MRLWSGIKVYLQTYFGHSLPNHLLHQEEIPFSSKLPLFKSSIHLSCSHHLAHYNDFGPQLFVDGKYVDESQGEHHVVDAKYGPTQPIGPREQSDMDKQKDEENGHEV